MNILRTHSQLFVLLWLMIALLWTTGGYFLVHRSFKLKKEEELITGFGVGVVAYLFLCNIFGRYFNPILGFTLPAVIIFFLGYVSTRRNIPNPFQKGQVSQWVLIASGIILAAFFYLISRGISLFDEYKNLSIISQMGRGIIPPTYESIETMGYHYGFQLLGASLMAIGGFFPWSAFDMGKAIVWGYTIILLILIARRYLLVWWKSALAGLIFVFAGGTRYLLFLVPSSWMSKIDVLIELRGTSASMEAPLSKALHMPWTIDGGPPGSYIFGFMNGIYPNYVMSHTGTGTMSIMIFLLLWLLFQFERSKWSIALYTVIFSFWALTWESSFGLFGLGMGLMGIYYLALKRNKLKDYFLTILLPGIFSLPIVIFQGGVITDRMSVMLVQAIQASQTPSARAGTFLGFWFRFPPAIPSAHLGNLSLGEPLLVLVAIAEVGLVVLFLPWVTSYLLKRIREGETFAGIMLFSTWIGFLVPCIIGFMSDRDITRFSGYAIGVWIILLSFDILSMKKWNLYRIFGALALAIMCIGGVVNLNRELPAIAAPVNSYYVKDLDVEVANDVWGKLPKSCKIYDPAGYRSVILTGCKIEMTYRNSYTKLPQWQIIKGDPTPAKLHSAGYGYAYFDSKNWIHLTASTRDLYLSRCVSLIMKVKSDKKEVRLFQINDCE